MAYSGVSCILFFFFLLICNVSCQIYVCAQHKSNETGGCRLNNLKVLADTTMDYKSFARKICDFLTINATIISPDNINMKLYNEFNTKVYHFYQYILLAYALDKELPKSYHTVYSNRLNSKKPVSRMMRKKINPYNEIWLEFGVEKGFSINMTSIVKGKHATVSLTNADTIFGFDWFNGLPIEWYLNGIKTSYSMKGSLPIVRNDVKLVVGLFNDTLPTFLSKNEIFNDERMIGFVNIDNDLYEGARDILIWLTQSGKMRFGAIVHFHELVRRKNQASKCYGQEELLGLYDAMRLLPHLKLELLSYHHGYFQSVLFRYLTSNRMNHGINKNIEVPYTYGGGADEDQKLLQYVRDHIFVKILDEKTNEMVYRYSEEEM